jgi:3-deoxy-D-manno-octulosonate 8-phosphate phosphatase KdsC-like HAD superfamily phosphatase
VNGNCLTKKQAAQRICEKLGITLAEVCYVGDDINDIDLLRAVGYPCCPPNARPEVKALTRASGAKNDIQILATPGGQGAIREIADQILKKISKK